MDKDFIIAQAEQDQQWMALDDWYTREQGTEDLQDIIATLDNEVSPKVIKKIRRIDDHGLEIVRLLALHTLRELALRNESAKERAKLEKGNEDA